MAQGRYNALFLSNRNTARSIFAEAVMNHVGGQNFKGFSKPGCIRQRNSIR
jgi:protein-tyrosine-phosphatase